MSSALNELNIKIPSYIWSSSLHNYTCKLASWNWNVHPPQKQKCHFNEILITGCTGSCNFDNFQCSQWWKFNQNDISVSVWWLKLPYIYTNRQDNKPQYLLWKLTIQMPLVNITTRKFSQIMIPNMALLLINIYMPRCICKDSTNKCNISKLKDNLQKLWYTYNYWLALECMGSSMTIYIYIYASFTP